MSSANRSQAAFGQAHFAYRCLALGLSQRRQAPWMPAARWLPDWVDPSAIQSLALALPGPTAGKPVVQVALRPGIPLRSLPGTLAWAGLGEPLALQPVRAAPALAQAAPGVVRQGPQGEFHGTATCLLQDRLAPARSYLLTCGHVAAPDSSAAVNQVLGIDDDGHRREGRLVDWQPSMGAAVYRTAIDAALVEVAAADALALRRVAGFVPAGLGGAPSANMAVSLRRCSGPLDGTLLVFWSGFVDLPGLSPGYPDYFLADAIGYRASQPTLAGDSGAAIWDSAERLMGMHLGALPEDGQQAANAVYGPIAPVLDWYSVQPYLQGDAVDATPGMVAAPNSAAAPVVQARTATPLAGPAGFDAQQEIDIVAATLWGEARNQGEQGMRAVASVIENRRRQSYRGKATAAAVCLDPWQFSCWNANDPNLPRLRRLSSQPDAQYLLARRIAAEVQQGSLADITRKARHYYAASLRPPAYWSRGKSPCVVIGDHLFFNDID